MASPKVWYKLDNAATVFPGQNTSRWSNIFRFSVVLDRKIEQNILEEALNNVLVRFPCYDVRIKRGFFWYYFEKNPNGAPLVELLFRHYYSIKMLPVASIVIAACCCALVAFFISVKRNKRLRAWLLRKFFI